MHCSTSVFELHGCSFLPDLSDDFMRILSVCFLLFLPVLVLAEDIWPEYRGPSGDGHATDADLPDKIDDGVVQWKTAIHGKGWSSPVVWGKQIWLTTATEDGA